MHDGLDGIAIDLPALKVKPTHDGLIPLNIQVKDPIWPQRDMIDVSVSVSPGEARTLWLDLRDRILTDDSLYLTIASAAPDFDAASLKGMNIRLVFKDRAGGEEGACRRPLQPGEGQLGLPRRGAYRLEARWRSTAASTPTSPTCCASIPTTCSAANIGPTSATMRRGRSPSPSRRRRPACRSGPSASSRT